MRVVSRRIRRRDAKIFNEPNAGAPVYRLERRRHCSPDHVSGTVPLCGSSVGWWAGGGRCRRRWQSRRWWRRREQPTTSTGRARGGRSARVCRRKGIAPHSRHTRVPGTFSGRSTGKYDRPAGRPSRVPAREKLQTTTTIFFFWVSFRSPVDRPTGRSFANA